MAADLGAAFMKQYLKNHWKHDRKQTSWSIEPSEDDVKQVRIIYEVEENRLFQNLQLVFEVKFHEEHPYKAPSIKVLTPNGRFEINKSICIAGLTAWHPEDWRIITSFSSIVERFMCAFLDTEHVTLGVGFIHKLDAAMIAKYCAESRAFNKAHFTGLVQTFEEQKNDYACEKIMNEDGRSSTSAATSDPGCEEEYVYDDD